MAENKHTDDELRDIVEARKRRLFHHMSQKNQCRYCQNSGVMQAADEKNYIYAFICTFCRSNEIAERNPKTLPRWDNFAYPGLVVRFVI